ncbi:hypothetical protein AP285_02410 [Limnospira platensis YZ]|nr:hypothetical protein AP285_02410 [Arthrospira platensis YZ]
MAIASLKRGLGKPKPTKTTNNAWKAIPWSKVQRKVFKLQKSISKQLNRDRMQRLEGGNVYG